MLQPWKHVVADNSSLKQIITTVHGQCEFLLHRRCKLTPKLNVE